MFWWRICSKKELIFWFLKIILHKEFKINFISKLVPPVYFHVYFHVKCQSNTVSLNIEMTVTSSSFYLLHVLHMYGTSCKMKFSISYMYCPSVLLRITIAFFLIHCPSVPPRTTNLGLELRYLVLLRYPLVEFSIHIYHRNSIPGVSLCLQIFSLNKINQYSVQF